MSHQKIFPLPPLVLHFPQFSFPSPPAKVNSRAYAALVINRGWKGAQHTNTLRECLHLLLRRPNSLDLCWKTFFCLSVQNKLETLGYVTWDVGLRPAMQSNTEGYHTLRTDRKMAGHDTELLDMASLWVCACAGDGGSMYNVCVHIHTCLCVCVHSRV